MYLIAHDVNGLNVMLELFPKLHELWKPSVCILGQRIGRIIPGKEPGFPFICCTILVLVAVDLYDL